MITAQAFITQSKVVYGTAERAKAPLTMSDASICVEPAIISQSGLNKSSLQAQEAHESQFPKEKTLEPEFLKLFIARQKDLQLSRNIELQLVRFSQLIWD